MERKLRLPTKYCISINTTSFKRKDEKYEKQFVTFEFSAMPPFLRILKFFWSAVSRANNLCRRIWRRRTPHQLKILPAKAFIVFDKNIQCYRNNVWISQNSSMICGRLTSGEAKSRDAVEARKNMQRYKKKMIEGEARLCRIKTSLSLLNCPKLRWKFPDDNIKTNSFK